MIRMIAKFALILLSGVIITTNGLKCYSCTLTLPIDAGENVDRSCIEDPANAPGKNVITCPERMKYCTIVRNDYKDTADVESIERNCSEEPYIMNDDIEGPDTITHFRTCTQDLCNKGTGLENPDLGGGGESIGGMMVLGVDAAPSLTSSALSLLMAVVVALYFV